MYTMGMTDKKISVYWFFSEKKSLLGMNLRAKLFMLTCLNESVFKH